MLNVAKWQSGVVARAEPNLFELCRALAISTKSEWRCGRRIICSPCPLSTKSNTRGSIITDSMPRNYGSMKLGDFVLKIAPMLRFDESRMMLASILPNLSNFDGKSHQIEGQNLEPHEKCCNFALSIMRDTKRDSATRCRWPQRV